MGEIRLPDTKTGPRTISLAPEALAVLSRIPRRSGLGGRRRRGRGRPGRGPLPGGHGAHGGGDAADADAGERRPCAPGGGAWVEAEAARMAGRDLASAFYPEEIEADPERLSVEIAGELVTWIGREEA